MRQSRLKLFLVGLLVLLMGTACVQLDSDIRINSDGLIEEIRNGILLRDASILSLATVPEDQIEQYAFFWFLTTQLSGFNRDDHVAGIDIFINLDSLRKAGLDLEAEGIWDESTIIHGKDPETGYVYVEYRIDLAEFLEELSNELITELGDEFVEEFGSVGDFAAELAALREALLLNFSGIQVQTFLEYNLITRMPGKVIEASHGQTLPGQPDVHVVRLNLLNLLEGPLVIRVVADPQQPVLPYETIDIAPHQSMQKDVWQAGRFWLNEQVAVQDVTFRAGEQFPEISGQIYNSGDQAYKWVSLGLSLFDIEGRFIDHHTLLIQNVGAGEERGFRKRLFDGDLSNVVFYRLEWAMGL